MTDNSLKAILKRGLRAIGKGLIKCHLLPKIIILRMDGGICSQMHFYLVGKTLERGGNRVIYDLDWYRAYGKDMDGRFSRNFDLLKLFPGLKFDSKISPFILKIYASLFYYHNNYFDETADPHEWQNLKSPLFLDGYFRDDDGMYGALYDSTFKIDRAIFEGANHKALEAIESAGRASCAVHVRRGDLARYNPAYGEPACTDYFRKAIERVMEETDGEANFFIFSDEPDWCQENVTRFMPEGTYKIMDQNGSDKGYIDLALMSRCHCIIASQGSMGKYGALLRPEGYRDGLVVLLKNHLEEWGGRFPNVIGI